jgi:hypothetical protein
VSAGFLFISFQFQVFFQQVLKPHYFFLPNDVIINIINSRTGTAFNLNLLDIIRSIFIMLPLEVVDEKYLQEKREREAKQLEKYKSAQNVIKHVGPKGGFKDLNFEYFDSDDAKVCYSLGIKSEAEKLIEIVMRYGIEVSEKII